MTVLYIILALSLLLILSGIIRIACGEDSGMDLIEDFNSSHASRQDPGPRPSSSTYFIDRKLHSNDARHARHKQNQTPW